MKTKDYVSKYKLDEVNHSLNTKEFVGDLTIDFFSLLEVGNSRGNIKGFENAVRAIRMKFDAVNNKTVGCINESVWSYFYASVVIKIKKQLFPQELARREAQKKQREAYKRSYENAEREMFGGANSFWDNLFSGFLLNLLKTSIIPTSSFTLLGLTETANIEDVKNNFRQLSMQHHPDKGGNNDKFIEIVEAKNKCLAYLSK